MRDNLNNSSLFFDAVRDVLGESGVDALCRDFGGSDMRVPCGRLQDGSPLALAVGMEAASAIIDRLRVIGADGRPLGGFKVYIRAGAFSDREVRRAGAVDAVRNGMTRRAAARLMNVSENTVRRAVRRAGIPDPRGAPNVPDAAVIAAHAEGPTLAAMASRLGLSTTWLRTRLVGLREKTGLALQLERSAAQIASERARWEAAAARDAAIIAAYAEGPTLAAMAVRLGLSRDALRHGLARARERTGRPLPVRWHRRPACFAKRSPPSAHDVAAMEMRLGVSPGRVGVTRMKALMPPRGCPNKQIGQERRRAITAAYAPEATMTDLMARTGLTEGVMQKHLARLRRETGHPFTLARRVSKNSSLGHEGSSAGSAARQETCAAG